MRNWLWCGVLVIVSVGLVARGDPATLSADSERMINDRQMRPVAYAIVSFLELSANGKVMQTQKLFQTTARVRESLENGDVAALLRRVSFQRPFKIELVGFSVIGQASAALVFVATTADGPVGIKVCIYRHETTNYVARVDATADWGDLEAMVATVDKLPVSLIIAANKEEKKD
jgi:hypothetical protein